MADTERYSQYRNALIGLINSINLEIPLTPQNQVLIVWQLNTVEKIQKFFKWIVENMKEGKLQATEKQIIQASSRASKE